MRFVLGALVLLFNCLDNATTFLCLREPVAGFEVFEANPVARVLFDSFGLLEGLLLELGFTLLAVGFLVFSERIPQRLKLALLAVLVVLPAWASVNNLLVIHAVRAVEWI